jgi:hypothetical protein
MHDVRAGKGWMVEEKQSWNVEGLIFGRTSFNLEIKLSSSPKYFRQSGYLKNSGLFVLLADWRH